MFNMGNHAESSLWMLFLMLLANLMLGVLIFDWVFVPFTVLIIAMDGFIVLGYGWVLVKFEST